MNRHYKQSGHSWAIALGRHGMLAGPVWFFDGDETFRPASEGWRTALFHTRAAARAALPDVRKAVADARIVKVFVRFEVAA